MRTPTRGFNNKAGKVADSLCESAAKALTNRQPRLPANHANQRECRIFAQIRVLRGLNWRMAVLWRPLRPRDQTQSGQKIGAEQWTSRNTISLLIFLPQFFCPSHLERNEIPFYGFVLPSGCLTRSTISSCVSGS